MLDRAKLVEIWNAFVRFYAMLMGIKEEEHPEFFEEYIKAN